VPIAFSTAERIREDVKITLPQGYTVDLTGHRAGRQTHGGLAVTLEAAIVEDHVNIVRQYDATPGRWPANEIEAFHAALKGARTFKRNALTLKRSTAGTPTTPAPAATPVAAPAPAP
jgi:hypothetical protein